MEGTTGPARFLPIARRLGMGAGVALGIGMILYAIGDMALIGDFTIQNSFGFTGGLTQYLAIALFGLFIFLLLGASVIRRALAYNGQRLRGRGLMSTVVIGSLYLIVEGAALLSLANRLGGSTSIGTTITNNGILLIASGVLTIAAGALLLQSGQSSRIAGGFIAIVAAVLLADLINGQASTTVSLSSFSVTNIPAYYTAFVLEIIIRTSTISTSGYFLAMYWAEIGSVIIGAAGLLIWAVLSNRKEAKYAPAVGVAGLLIYGIGILWYGFQTSTSIFNALGSIASSNLTGYANRVLSESQILAWSLLIVGIAGILTLIASGFGIGLTVAGAGEPVITRQQTVLVPASATGGAFCRKCGAQAKLGDTHCRSCGASLT